MASENLNKLRAELQAALEQIIPEIEGLEDYSRLNIRPDTKAQVTAAHADFKKRQQLLVNGIKALDDLTENNYPERLDREVLEAVYEDLKAQKETIKAALGVFFRKEEAASATIVPGDPEPK